MSVKNKLKQRLLEIPINWRAYRENYRLAEDIDADLRKVEFYLNELVQLNILIKKNQYLCPNCGDITIMTDELLNDVIEDGYFECDNCMDFINPNKNITGYVYYDIKDKALLEAW
ncbi:hypothetical protein B2H86_14895 [Clostridium botulinum]|uniref:hypothetical protein n=1 Tax=Clostridium botulinum TaxID=1491 RepID=UPI000A177507|nr:hypothetical protein [Clostridium botulinum]OSA73631.1 hypothetical protein B2H86_14895 [Clostridium botulinum]